MARGGGRSGGGGPFLGDAIAIWNGIKSALPFLEDEAQITVTMSPKGSLQRGFFLAAATAHSLVRRYDIAQEANPPPGLIMVEYDSASNQIVYRIRYRTCLTTSAIVDQERLFRELPVYTGPQAVVVGSEFNFTAQKLSGVPKPAQLPANPFAQKAILARWPTTPDPKLPFASAPWVPSPNPRPCGDQRSRGVLYQMVYSALTTPQGQGAKMFNPPRSKDLSYIGD